MSSLASIPHTTVHSNTAQKNPNANQKDGATAQLNTRSVQLLSLDKAINDNIDWAAHETRKERLKFIACMVVACVATVLALAVTLATNGTAMPAILGLVGMELVGCFSSVYYNGQYREKKKQYEDLVKMRNSDFKTYVADRFPGDHFSTSKVLAMYAAFKKNNRIETLEKKQDSSLAQQINKAKATLGAEIHRIKAFS